MLSPMVKFTYSADEVDSIGATLGVRLSRFPTLQRLETSARSDLFRVARAGAALSKRQIIKERADRSRCVERVRRAIKISARAARVSEEVDRLVEQDPFLSRTRLLAQAMFDGKIDEFDFGNLNGKDLLSHPGQLAWQGSDRWLFADDRKKAHRFTYVNDLVCFWADERDCRPDEVAVSARGSAGGDRLMDFIMAAAGRPLREAGEEIGEERVHDLVYEVKDYWRGRPWEDGEEQNME